MSLGKLLKLAREKKGITRQQLADSVSANVNSIAKYERAGEKNGHYPPLPILAKLCIELNVAPGDIFSEVCETEKDRQYFQVKSAQVLETLGRIYFDLADSVGSMEAQLEMAREQLVELLPVRPDPEKFQKILDAAYPDGRGAYAILNLYPGQIKRPGTDKKNGPGESPSRSEISTSEPEVAPTTSPTKPSDEGD